jgi:hypothetical protein
MSTQSIVNLFLVGAFAALIQTTTAFQAALPPHAFARSPPLTLLATAPSSASLAVTRRENYSDSGTTLLPPPSSSRLNSGSSNEYDGDKSLLLSSIVEQGSRLHALAALPRTALLATLWATTRVSLAAVYAVSLAVTGAWIRQTMKVILGIFPAWFRCFLQPFLIVYYVPLFLLRSIARNTQVKAKRKQKRVLDSWRQNAAQLADETAASWPLRVANDGFLRSDFQSVVERVH